MKEQNTKLSANTLDSMGSFHTCPVFLDICYKIFRSIGSREKAITLKLANYNS